MLITDEMLPDAHVRGLSICPGCGGPKSGGCLVCWDCFKYRLDITPLKYYGGSLADWLNEFDIGLWVPLAGGAT